MVTRIKKFFKDIWNKLFKKEEKVVLVEQTPVKQTPLEQPPVEKAPPVNLRIGTRPERRNRWRRSWDKFRR